MHKLNIKRLKACREKIGITKQEAAKRINVSQPAYLRYESGQRTPSIQVVTEMARVFNTSVDYLVGISDINSPDTFTISKSTDPELFEIISTYKSSDDNLKKRLLAYASRLIINNR